MCLDWSIMSAKPNEIKNCERRMWTWDKIYKSLVSVRILSMDCKISSWNEQSISSQNSDIQFVYNIVKVLSQNKKYCYVPKLLSICNHD